MILCSSGCRLRQVIQFHFTQHREAALFWLGLDAGASLLWWFGCGVGLFSSNGARVELFCSSSWVGLFCSSSGVGLFCFVSRRDWSQHCASNHSSMPRLNAGRTGPMTTSSRRDGATFGDVSVIFVLCLYCVAIEVAI